MNKPAIALAAAMLTLTPAADANADTTTFLTAAQNAGYNPADPAVLRDGYLACALQFEPADTLTGRILRQGLRKLGNETDTQTFTQIATTHLCPEAPK